MSRFIDGEWTVHNCTQDCTGSYTHPLRSTPRLLVGSSPPATAAWAAGAGGSRASAGPSEPRLADEPRSVGGAPTTGGAPPTTPAGDPAPAGPAEARLADEPCSVGWAPTSAGAPTTRPAAVATAVSPAANLRRSVEWDILVPLFVPGVHRCACGHR